MLEADSALHPSTANNVGANNVYVLIFSVATRLCRAPVPVVGISQPMPALAVQSVEALPGQNSSTPTIRK